MTGTEKEEDSDEIPVRELPSGEAGFIKFYGLFWRKELVDWDQRHFLGQPRGWQGGRVAAGFDRKNLQVNFWSQNGVYVLYDQHLHPVYAGQAGLSRKNAKADGSRQGIGDRLNRHRREVFKNAWSFFSWFGFLDMPKLKLRSASENERLSPDWNFTAQSKSELNDLLASFEAILIEGFSPRFNARGGDLKTANLVDQFEPPP